MQVGSRTLSGWVEYKENKTTLDCGPYDTSSWHCLLRRLPWPSKALAAPKAMRSSHGGLKVGPLEKAVPF